MLVWQSTDGTPHSTTEGLWFYNALDCCVTLEVFEEIYPQLNEITSETYKRGLDMQGPVLELECRGIKVDQENINRVAAGFYKDLQHVHEGLKEILIEGLGLREDEVSTWKKEKGQLVEKFIWNSPKQLMELLYGRMGLPAVKKRMPNGTYAPTVNRDALEKLASNFHAEPIILHILKIRDLNKDLGVLRTGIDPDGRMRFSINIVGTDTGRMSSYESCTGSGTNIQNITEDLREIFVADEGKKFAYIDLAQVQSRGVGAICWNLFHIGTYLDFCESGDLHTGVCMMTWTDRDWKGSGLEALTNPEWYAHNRALANLQFYRQDSYRQGSKKLGHATNFLGKPHEISKQTRIPVDLITPFQAGYFKGFPEIPEWHSWLAKKLVRDGFITTLTGRQRWFFGRRYDPATVRQAAAYEPQDIESYLNKTSWLQLWRAHIPGVEVLVPAHDALLIQYDEEREDELIPQILEILKVPIPLMYGRTLLVPNDVAVGWNWRHAYNDKKELVNPDGLIEYKGSDQRTRSTPVSILDRKFY